MKNLFKKKKKTKFKLVIMLSHDRTKWVIDTKKSQKAGENQGSDSQPNFFLEYRGLDLKLDHPPAINTLMNLGQSQDHAKNYTNKVANITVHYNIYNPVTQTVYCYSSMVMGNIKDMLERKAVLENLGYVVTYTNPNESLIEEEINRVPVKDPVMGFKATSNV